MKLRKLWKTYNVSTLLVLPLYSEICSNSSLKLNSNYTVPFVQLCFECGLIQTFLQEDRFIMQFNEKVLHKNALTKSIGFSLAEQLIGFEKFIEILETKDDSIAFSYKLYEEFKSDLDHIRNSEYSLVSNEYKERLRITQNRVPILDNELSNSIVKYNIPLSITIKARHLKQELMDLLEVGDTMFERELYSMFDKNKERWQP